MRSKILLALLFGIVPAAYASVGAVTKPILVKPAASATGQIVSGRQLFLNTCASCHGPAGLGDDGPNLTVVNLDQGSIERTVRTGIPGQMPSFAKRFKPTELDRLATYVISLQKH